MKRRFTNKYNWELNSNIYSFQYAFPIMLKEGLFCNNSYQANMLEKWNLVTISYLLSNPGLKEKPYHILASPH